jgi:hypothetical protein
MPGNDWRSPEAYARIQEAEISGLAWECLRRNFNYRYDYREIASAKLENNVTAEFRRKWGLCFRC